MERGSFHEPEDYLGDVLAPVFILVPVAWGADPSYPLEKGPVEPSIWANGKLVTGWEVPPRIEEGRLMAPVRLLATSMGAEVR